MMDAGAACTPFLHDIKPLPEEQHAALLKKVDATPESLKRDVKILREWLAQQPHLPQLGEDFDPWLIRFLIGSKNSLQRAKEYLEKYCTSRAQRAELYTQGPSPGVENLFALIKSGVLPVTTPQGTRMVITKFTKEVGEDPSKMDWGIYFKLTVHMADVFLGSEGHPVDAEICMDLEHFTVALNNSFVANLSLFRQFVDTAQGSVPLHYKAVHLVNAPGIIKTVIAMVRPFLKDKLGERIIVHDTVESFHKCVDKACLPSDYGGQGKTLQQMCDDWHLIIHTNMPWILARQAKLAADESKRVGGKPRQDDFGVEGSFRKLAVD
ncbi:alpha-tocopherol transfer protein-like isoform X2 [Thrips palmi]|uniref:Alpha-tocopherol transfer protein-like isoform X2 n=2 Tax=Thrips palmi TaxID=161013 RepID=A0A6P8Z239_THRPL|nr:alpha-tocopherol transfer protein-like isoform X2 [Thrips palmi]